MLNNGQCVLNIAHAGHQWDVRNMDAPQPPNMASQPVLLKIRQFEIDNQQQADLSGIKLSSTALTFFLCSHISLPTICLQ